MAQHKIAILLHDEFEMWHPPAWFVDRLRAEFPQAAVQIRPASARMKTRCAMPM